MLFDSITITEGSHINNLNAASGTVFPAGSDGELFFRTDLNTLFYFRTQDGWTQIIETDIVPTPGISVNSSVVEGVKSVQLNLTGTLASLESLAGNGFVKKTNDVLSASSINLASDVTGNLGVANLANAQNANATTFWRGDGTWQSLGPNLSIPSGPTLPATATEGNLFFLDAGAVGLYFYDGANWIANGSGGSGSAGGKVVSNFAGVLASKVGQSRYYPAEAITIKSVHFSVGVTPTTGSVTVDVKKSGVSIFTAKPTLAAGEYLSNTVNVNAALTVNDWLTTDLTVTGVSGQDVTVIINYI